VNYFAHAYRFLSESRCSPEFLAGTATPDWLNVVARRTRCRRRHAQPLLQSSDQGLADLARGIHQHHEDDQWFHATAAFNELTLAVTRTLRLKLQHLVDLRAGFLGHILVELLMDAELIQREPQCLGEYYRRVAQVDARWVAEAVEQMCGRSVGRLEWFIGRFVEVKFLADYPDDARITYRLNQVLGRVGLSELPAEFVALLPELRPLVASRMSELLPA
jgi:hypothetical protein